MQKFQEMLFTKLRTDESRLSVIVSVSFLFLFIMLSYGALPEEIHWEEGMVAPKDILADRSLTYEDTEATEKKKSEALRRMDLVYKISTESFNTFTLSDIDERFVELEKILLVETGSNATKKIESLREKFDLKINDANMKALFSLNKNDIERLHSLAIYHATQVMNKGVSESNLSDAYKKITNSIRQSSNMSAFEKSLIIDLLKGVTLYPTAIFDEKATKEKETLALQDVDPISITVKKGQTIVNQGDIVSKEQYGALLALGYTTDVPLWVYALGIVIVLLVTFFMMYYYARYFSIYKEDWQKTFKIFIVVSMLQVGFMPIIFSLNLGNFSEGLIVSGYLLPMALGAMLISYLRNQKDSLFILLISTIYLAVYSSYVEFIIVAILGSLAGIAQTSRLSKRRDLLYVALSIALFNVIGVLMISFLKAQSLHVLFYALLCAIAGGFLSVILTFGILPYIEVAFKITTPMTLIELTDPTRPLLKRLMQEAPGTYHHSLMVANLAETIADELGANGLLVRAGAYYHDIGKLKRPAFFAENQFSGENAHDSISPMLSTLIVTSHVKDGVNLAKEEKLPDNVIDLIREHHGNTLVGCFYMKAKQLDNNVLESDFRYHQPKPQTKEAAILMIADTVEAAVRSKKGSTRGEISGFIRKLIYAKFDDGQFSECDLTFKEMNTIAEVCTRVMTGLYHKRVEYPSKEQLSGR